MAMNARKLTNLFLVLTIGLVVATLGMRISTDLGSFASRDTFVLVMPVFLALMTKRTQRYPKAGVVIGLCATLLAAAALKLAMG